MRQRLDIEFKSRGVTCRAWFYPAGRNTLRNSDGVPCVVMAPGFGGTRDAGLEPYAERFAAAGLAVLLFDYRHFGASDGDPRQLLSVRRQLQDLAAAIGAARALEGIDSRRIALWGSSFSGGHVVAAAVADRGIAAVAAQGPLMDGRAAVSSMISHAGFGAFLRLGWAGIRDLIGNLAGADPHYVPIVARPGKLAVMASAAAHDGYRAITPSTWRNEVAARTLLTLGFYRPGRRTSRLSCPVLIQICDEDRIAPAHTAEAAALRAGRYATERHYRIDHFDIYLGAGFRQSSADQVAFFQQHLSARPQPAP